jgi:hypothetical protein
MVVSRVSLQRLLEPPDRERNCSVVELRASRSGSEFRFAHALFDALAACSMARPNFESL